MSQDSSSNDDPLSAAWSFGKLMPGFGLFEQWAKGAGAAMPSMGQWVAPTLDPAELDKRIQDLRTVQFWLEQNARMIAMTVQALEVQRMTLDTLKSMNVPAEALRESLKARVPEPPSAPAAAEGAADPGSESGAPEDAATGATAGAAIDPMRWWGSLTKQFTDLAANTLQDALQTEGAAAQAKRGRATGAKSTGKTPSKAGGKAAGKASSNTASKAASGKATGKTAPAARRQSARRGSASAED